MAKIVSLGAVRALASALIQRTGLSNLVGITYEGERDLYKWLGYKRSICYEDYWQRYARGGIAGRVVDAYPSATWRLRPTLVDTTSKFDAAWTDMVKRLKLYHYFERIDRIAGIGRYGVLLIGVKGAAPLDQPMPKLTGPDDVLFVAPYSEGNAKIMQLDVDPASQRYGLPLIYEIALTRDINSAMIGTNITRNVKVHYTRVIHVADGLIEDDMYGIPRMQRVWNYLDDLDKVVGGGSEAVWRTVDRGIQFDVDKEMELGEDDEEDFSQAIEDYMHGLKRYIKTRGIKANVLGSDVPDPTGAIQAVMSLIAGTSGIPQRMLLGSEAGQLASGQDERNFNARVKERQTSYAEDVILSPFADRMMAYGALPRSKYKVKWPDVSTLTEKERADVAARFAQAIANVAKQTQGGAVVMTAEDFKAKFIDD